MEPCKRAGSLHQASQQPAMMKDVAQSTYWGTRASESLYLVKSMDSMGEPLTVMTPLLGS